MASTMAAKRLFSPREIEGLIAEGQLIVIHEGFVLRLDGWLEKHPGGRLAILHMVGRDATDEINVYHFQHTLRLMKAYRIGRVSMPWINFEPPLRGGVYRKLGSDEAVKLDCHKPSWTPQNAQQRATPAFNLNIERPYDDVDTGDEELVSARGTWTPQPPSLRSDVSTTLSRAAYTAALEQEEIAKDIRSNPSLDLETQRAITLEYQALHERVKNEGYYDCRYSEYGKESIRYCLLFSTFIFFLTKGWYLTSACFLGMFWQQIMFVAHDAGHRGISGNFIADTLIGAFVADFCCGLSIGWWKSSHNVHHLITNMPEHDPDLQNVPLFANGPSYFRDMLSTFYNFTFPWDAAADFLVPYQKYTYYPIMGVARFNLYLLSWLHLMSPRAANLGSAWWTRPVEIAMMACYWYLFGWCLLWKTLPDWPTRVAFVLISHIITMLLHVQITLSHWGMSTADLGPTESFPQRQLRTTMDVDCPQWLDFLHGGLQFQAVHHLFPRVPRHNLRRLQVLIREFCHKTGIEYKCYAFVEGNKVVVGRLAEVGKMVDILVQCQQHMATTGDSGLH
ncbi:delta 8-(E)-sphingolipid desaturase [Mytilinidion resinicola]|uniref:Delta 8-(E)-sphingolipid desaturase n=1 Tax=Mytilinidion resinicola TaxID=574789 RepID=A0A6A6Z5H6_9PEZI|nr:delta 8-(E)-sphingolipid desaturase [Mytilinidion resinicola]KAF2815989.1 delta 8-(E)-sphingolipid desaturase [Mytilinidion resinicola]